MESYFPGSSLSNSASPGAAFAGEFGTEHPGLADVTGEHALGEHPLGEHLLGEHLLGEHLLGEHILGEHLLSDHAVGEHSMAVPAHPSAAFARAFTGEHALLQRARPVQEYRAPRAVRSAGPTVTVRQRPLRIAYVGMQTVNAGIDNWLTALVRYSDPDRLRFVRCVVTTEQVDHDVVARRQLPVVIGGRDAVRQAVEDCDILMMAGPPQLGEWLQDKPPRLGIFVAHGVCKGTQIFLETCRPALDHVVAVSPLVQDAICAGLPSTVIPNGIDPRHIVQTHSREDVRTALGCRSDEFLIGYVGRFSPEKRPEALIEAVRRLPARFRLVFVGWGDLRHNLLDLASRRIPGRLSVVQANDDLGNYYAAMDAFCFPSEFEGFGLVLLEAMMCTRPVITTQVGFAPEGIVDRVNGVVVDGSPESIASAVDLIDRHPTWARAMATEGRLYAEKAGFASQMARSYTALFERLWAEKFGS